MLEKIGQLAGMRAYLGQELLGHLWHHPGQAKAKLTVSTSIDDGAIQKDAIAGEQDSRDSCSTGRRRDAICLPINLGLIDDLDAGVTRDLTRDAAIAAAHDEHLLCRLLTSASANL